MEFLAKDRLRLRIRRSAHKAGRFEPPLPSPSGGRLDSAKKIRCRHRATRVSQWLPLMAKSIRQRQQSAAGPKGSAAVRRTHQQTMAKRPRLLEGDCRLASARPTSRPKPVGQVAVPAARRAAPEERPRILLTTPKESGHRYKIFINVTHPPLQDIQKHNLTNSLSTTSDFRPLPEKQKKCDKFDKSGTSMPLNTSGIVGFGIRGLVLR